MFEPHGIIVFESKGRGKTSLGRELACILGFKYILMKWSESGG